MRQCQMALPHQIAAALLFIMMGTSAWGQTYETKKVLVGYTEIVKLSRPAITVLIGDPTVADVNLDKDLVFLTGKALGTTNVIALDEDNVQIYHAVVDVGRGINVFEPDRIQTYVCNPKCRQLRSK